MFSTEDVREMLGLFPPSHSNSISLPCLIHASSGQSLVTLNHLETAFEKRVTEDTSRTSISDLSDDFDVDRDVTTQLVQSRPKLALLSNAGDQVVPKVERDAIFERLLEALSNGLVERKKFALQKNVSSESVGLLLDLQEEKLMQYGDHNDCVCTEAYEAHLSYFISDYIDRVISNTSSMDLKANDFEELPGSPPRWLVLNHVKRLVESEQVAHEVFFLETSYSIRIQSRHLRARNVQGWARRLLSGELAYIDLQMLSENAKNIYDSIDGVLSDFREIEGVEVVETFALSERWISKLVGSRVQTLHYKEDGVLDLAQNLGDKIQHGELWALAPGNRGRDEHRKFPERLYSHVERKIEQYIDTTLAQEPRMRYHCFGTIVLTDEKLGNEREALVTNARELASTQWHQLQQNHDQELEFTPSNPTSPSTISSTIQTALLRQKPVQKACDEAFWSAISPLETRNESDFATFWTERVQSRVQIHTDGLASIEDQKLQEQLSELLTTYIQKDLVPEVLSKARAQDLVLSRKTRKNMLKFESTLPAAKDLPSMLSTLEKFIAKQSIPLTSPPALSDFKSSMLNDMRRRMSKATKSADGPVLFLTLVVVLFAKHYAGIVYATGKYAPKLLKLLKGKLEEGEYARVEGWKEGAKKGSLSAEDREGMRVMAEA
ncbi:hypothetical protein EK21DRAFT_108125 [Setomelanomma holmii]|uniref:Uncharacterized protein n=1 Tax=Setomelanomma holmii TaxID=210430 RepID=A0A9P4HI85_9PLEO|nr:hypothetical protein EK21DRAFT_108125 [Setomelanomma holmii]